MWTTKAGSFGRPRQGLRREVRAVGLRQDAVGGDSRQRPAQLVGLGERDVAGEGHVVASLDGGGQQLGLGEAVEDDGAAEPGEHRRGLGDDGTSVNHERQAELVGERDLRLEEPVLLRERRVVVVVVEPRLAHRHSLRVREQGTELADALRFRRRGLVGIDAERREHAVVRRRELERRPARVDAGADRDDPRRPRRRARARGSLPAPRTRPDARACRSRGCDGRRVDPREERLGRFDTRGLRPCGRRPLALQSSSCG